MPRRRFITIVCLTAAMFACPFIAYFAVNQWTPEPYYQGRSASDWLRTFDTRTSTNLVQTIDAFRAMGTKAEPVLVAAMTARDNSLDKIYRRMYPRLPWALHQHLPRLHDPSTLRSASFLILFETGSGQVVPKLLPFLKEPDSELRLRILQVGYNRLGPSNANQVRFVRLAANDTNLDVRMAAALALWQITSETNTTIPVLEGALRQDPNEERRLRAAGFLVAMGQSNSLVTTTLINSLTNDNAALRATACYHLGLLGPPVASAIPALREALNDPTPVVRQYAKSALSRIDPEHN